MSVIEKKYVPPEWKSDTAKANYIDSIAKKLIVAYTKSALESRMNRTNFNNAEVAKDIYGIACAMWEERLNRLGKQGE